MALGREQLDALTCGCGGVAAENGHKHETEPLYFHSRCHPDSPTWTVYDDGEVRVECSECERTVTTIKVAP